MEELPSNWKVVFFLVCLLAAAVGGYRAGRGSHQNVNDLIEAGFTVTDPEGYEVYNFEEDYGILGH